MVTNLSQNYQYNNFNNRSNPVANRLTNPSISIQNQAVTDTVDLSTKQKKVSKNEMSKSAKWGIGIGQCIGCCTKKGSQ